MSSLFRFSKSEPFDHLMCCVKDSFIPFAFNWCIILSVAIALKVPDHLFSGNQEFFATTDIRMQPTMEQLQEIWDTVAHKEQSCTDLLMVPCNAAVIPLPDAAQLSRRGILQNLLLSRADHSVYLSMPMKVIIWYKWKSYGNRMLLDELWHYILLLLFFTTYCILLGQKKNGGEYDKVEEYTCGLFCCRIEFYRFSPMHLLSSKQ